jgi:predicted acyl esterase
LLVLCLAACHESAGKVSTFGKYDGYSEPTYTEFVRTSVHVPMRDGVKLAVDIYRPAIDGVPVETPMPVLLRYSRYRRAQEMPDGSIWTPLGVLAPGSNTGPLDADLHSDPKRYPVLVSHGYILVGADARGTGASFGVYHGSMSRQEAQDGYDLVEWLAAQPFSTGKVGMIGGSYFGQVMFLTVSTAPPSLKAGFPAVAYFDEYQSWQSGAGVLRKAGIVWTFNQMRTDGLLADGAEQRSEVARVDADEDGSLLRAAYAERRAAAGNLNPVRALLASREGGAEAMDAAKSALGITDDLELVRLLFGPTHQLAERSEGIPDWLRAFAAMADTRGQYDNPDTRPGGASNLWTLLPKINASGIPIYNWGGWQDGYVDATALWHVNLDVPRKLTIGPWTHSPNEPDDPREEEGTRLVAIEQLRWFDYWMKGIDNGVMDEPAVNYAVLHSPSDWEWRRSADWPAPGTDHVPFYFADGPSGTIRSVNDGLLSPDAPGDEAVHRFTVDYSATMGVHDRFYDMIGGGPLQYPDLAAHANTALTYTSEPLTEDLTIAGHPIVRLQASSSADDGEFLVYLQEVDADGRVHYLSEGLMRASHRILGDPPYDFLGLPWSESSRTSIDAAKPLNIGPTSLAFDMKPVANRFEKGHRIRVVVAGADSDGTLTLPYVPAPEQQVFVGGASPSLIEFPLLQEH